jgi:hypothetical protein
LNIIGLDQQFLLFRPKIQKLLPTFLTEFPKLKNHQSNEIWQKEQIQRGCTISFITSFQLSFPTGCENGLL